MAKKILFVVHRYAPFPGGSETNVKNMAEEMVRRGYEVTVLAYTNQGDLNGVAVTGDHSLAFSNRWDLIIVHGGDVNSQNFVHDNYSMIQAPVLYLIIKPSESDVCLKGLHNHKYLGYGTSFDYNLIDKYGLKNKARLIRYGIPVEDTVFEGNVQRPSGKMFVSIGGFAPHKRMVALADAFKKANLEDTLLVLLGYDNGEIPKNEHNVICGFGMPKGQVMNIVRSADALIMNSSEEGFGLVLLEAMMNKTPWIARDIAGAHDMQDCGTIYNTEDELIEILRNFKPSTEQIEHAYKYVMTNHTIAHCVTDIEKVLDEHY
jgi:glycosyltransferase involved in cell wall biosynthesis